MKTEDIDKKIGMPDVNDEWAKFESEVINKEEAAPRKSRRPLYIWLGGLGIAASLLLLFVLNMKEPQSTGDTPMIAQVQKPLKAEPVKEVQEAQPEEQEVQPIAQARPIKKEMQSIGTSVDMSEFEDLAITEVDEALQGRVAGLDVVENSGNLGSGNSVRLRGTGAMSSDGDNSPLIVVNGEILHIKLDDEVMMHATDKDFPQILHLEGQTVESINVLKGATATAVYGRQGGNGVIEITTKKKIKTLPDSLIAKVKTYEKKSDPKILVGRDNKGDSLQSRNRNPKYGLPIPHREVTGKINMEDFEGIMIKIDEVEDNTKYVVPSSQIAPIIKQKRAKKNQPKSITFKVDENLKALEKKVVAHYDGRLAAQYLLGQDGVKVEDQHVVALSFADAQNLRIVVKDAFYQCMVKAYVEHKSVTLSPDMMWLLISQGFARYVNAHSEELRSQLVYHEGKQDLMVMTKDDLLSGKADWGKLLNDFSKEIERHTKGEVAKTIAADFSTTTPVERIASQITLMESMKSYFNYLAVRIGCGIPSVTLQGTPDDWRAVLSKTQKLGQYGLSEWTQTLEPILNEFIKTAEGNPNQRFWQEMVKKQRVDEFASARPCSADKPTELDGWILKFFPTEDGYTLDRVPYTKSMPAEFVRVEFKYRVIDPITGATLSETPMELMSGFIGALDDEKNNMLTPQIGWLVRARE
ncbi:DUF4419 domain-containing protein [uncultured Prevotella sp.]|uniref:DUF4419 domain-containing protein n=1 Tax=uncultured Prevotella sp. TaxID=159272 RepID=UPI0025875DFB|nr:DUF4419 domain-containing protein [uncultured Prevotella sp.]